MININNNNNNNKHNTMQVDENLQPANNMQLWQSLIKINEELTNNNNNQAIEHMRTLLDDPNTSCTSSRSSSEKQRHIIIKCLTSQLFHSYGAMSVMDVYKMLEFLCTIGTQFGVTQQTLNSYVMKYALANELEYQLCPISNAPFDGDNQPIVRPEMLKLLVEQVKLDGSDSASAVICALALRKPQQLLFMGQHESSSVASLIMFAWRGVASGNNDNVKSSAFNSTVSIRYCTLMMNLAMQSDEAMQCLIPRLDEMMEVILWSDEACMDPLMQMSALDLLEKMATKQPMLPNRSKWLLSRRMLLFLLRLSGGGDEHECPDPILGAPALRLLACLCRHVQSDSSLMDLAGRELLQGFRNALLKTETHGELERLAYIDAVSSFAASSSDAMEMVLSESQLYEGWLSLTNAQPKMKAVIMHSISQIIEPQRVGDNVPTSSISNPTIIALLNIFGDVNSCSVPEMLLTFGRKPVMETKLAAYNLMRAMCKCGSMLLLLLSHAGFAEFLVNRETDATKEGKEAKFVLIEAIVNGDVNARGLLADDIARKLDEIAKQGPHYVKAMSWQMMTE